MRITVHRGTYQIGGCITEISTDSTRIFIDMGKNLIGGEQLTEVEEKKFVDKLFAQNKKQHEAIFYTHSHADHTGMIMHVPEHVEQYMSRGTRDLLLINKEVLLEKDKLEEEERGAESSSEDFGKRIKHISLINSCKTWERPGARQKPRPIIVGDIIVTPYFVSHSSYDCYMLLIVANGKKILHTGDYREHGYLGKGLFSTLSLYIKQVDYLITEGTMLREPIECEYERSISKRMYDVMGAFKYVFVLTSSTDIERLAAINSATTQRNRKLFACSLNFYKTLEYFNKNANDANNDLFKFDVYHYSISKENPKYIKSMQKNGFTMLCGSGHVERIKKIKAHFPASETLLIYSVWDGYYKNKEQYEANPNYQEFRSMFDNVVNLHTSGHADCKTIKEVIETVNPSEGIIIIHKEAGATFESLNLSKELESKIITNDNPHQGVTLY